MARKSCVPAKNAAWRSSLRASAVVGWALAVASGCADEAPPAHVEEYRRVVTLPSLAFDGCRLGLRTGSDAPALPALSDQELSTAAVAYAELVGELASFRSAPRAGASPDELVFGPVADGGVFRMGTISRMDDRGPRWTFVVRVGASPDPAEMITVLTGERRGSPDAATIVEITLDARAAAPIVGSGDGRVALRLESDPDAALGAWSSSAMVLAEWQPRGARTTAASAIATCSVQARVEGPLHHATAAIRRDVNGDMLRDDGTMYVLARPGVGGQAALTGRSGAEVSVRRAAFECWAADATRLLAAATDGSTTVTIPTGGTEALCAPPFGAPVDSFALPDLEPSRGEALVALVARAYDGLHAALDIEARPHRVLWVGAHPDDEGYAAPLLGRLCRDLGGTCTFLVVTNGSTGSCRIATGCPPDLGTWREAEMRDAAAVFGATVVQWRWPPGEFPGDPTPDLARWAAYLGSEDALVDAIAGVLETVRPEVVVTMDPRHGTSCHAEHRLVSQLLLRAVARATFAPRVLLSEGGGMPASVDDPALRVFDASQPSVTTGTDAWAFTTRDLALHPSQVFPADLPPIDATPAALRRLYLLDAADIVADDPRYALCPNR